MVRLYQKPVFRILVQDLRKKPIKTKSVSLINHENETIEDLIEKIKEALTE